MVGIDRERHQLVERDAILGIDVEQRWADRREAQPLLDDLDRYEEGGGDLLFTHAFLAHRLKRAELVERVQRRSLDILGEAVLFGEALGPDDARDRRVLRQPFLFGQQLERAEAAAAGRHLEYAGLQTRLVDDSADGQALQQGAPRDIICELLDGDARLDLANVRLGQDELVERDRALFAQNDLRL